MYPEVKEENTDSGDRPVKTLARSKFPAVGRPDSSRYAKYRGIFLPLTDQSAMTSGSSNCYLKGTEGKTALFYEDAVSGRSFRFILHRKNARKADIYACAKCKSRRKYVRIMVQNDKFLCDPASLDHICYMTPIELHNERVNNERLKQRKIKKLMAELPPLGLILSSHIRNLIVWRVNSPSSRVEVSVSTCPQTYQKRSPSFAVARETYRYTTSFCLIDDAFLLGLLSAALMDGKLRLQSLETLQVYDDAQNSEQEPGETKCTPMVRDEACLESIKMALESLPLHTRQKACVDIIHFVYTTIFEKY
ncbi:hypothetical protein Angca_000899, partial [Angiostrongylus cantonensis]